MSIPTTALLRAALRVHGTYFVLYAIAWQLFVPEVAALVGLEPPATVVGRVAADVSAGSMATIGVLLVGASFQKALPRFVVLAALVQTGLNLLHGASWIVHRHALALVVPDAVFITFVFGVYLRAWYTQRSTSALLDELGRQRGEGVERRT